MSSQPVTAPVPISPVLPPVLRPAGSPSGSPSHTTSHRPPAPPRRRKGLLLATTLMQLTGPLWTAIALQKVAREAEPGKPR